MIGDTSHANPTGMSPPVGRVRSRWLSGRAMLLHLVLVVVVPGCLAAGWWQATRALAGNGLSWFYSVEWPAFAVIAIVAWWHLIHEDPEAYQARRRGPGGHDEPSAAPAGTGDPGSGVTVPVTTFRLACVLAVGVAVDSAFGVAAVVLVPFGRPSGLLPARSAAMYLLHAALGGLLVLGAVVLLIGVRDSSRLSRLTGWIGGTGVVLSGVGGLLTALHPLRFAGMALMLLGAVTALFGYAIPAIEKLS